MAPKWTGKRIVGLQVFKEASWTIFGLSYEHWWFVLGYAVCIYYCATTIGAQYEEALLRAEEQNYAIHDAQDKMRMSALSFFAGEESGLSDDGTRKFRVPSKYLPGFWASMALGVCAITHGLVVLMQKWSIAFRCMMKFKPSTSVSEATHVRVSPDSHFGKTELLPLDKSTGATKFEFHRRTYLYDSSTDTFIKVRAQTQRPLEEYRDSEGLMEPQAVLQLTSFYGPNKFQISQPNFIDLYLQQMTSPLTVFQFFCVLLWLLDEYWQYSIFTAFMICMFEATVVFTRIKNLSNLKGMGNENRKLKTFRYGVWSVLDSEDLVPGDLISLVKGTDEEENSSVVPCDCLVLRGAAVVNEASLTGESIPQMKEGIHAAGDEILELKGAHKVHALFGGTKLMQVTGDKSTQSNLETKEDNNTHERISVVPDMTKTAVCPFVPSPDDGGCICYVLRTGFCSSQGKLVRALEHSHAAVRPDTRDTVLLLILLTLFAVCASTYVCVQGWNDVTRSKYDLLLHCVLIVTSVIPPELPMQMALAVNSSLMTLMRMQIFCTEPFRVPMAGKIDYCLFDKTGTLTTDELVAVGVVPPDTSVQSLIDAEELAHQQNRKRQEAKQIPLPPAAQPNPNENPPDETGKAEVMSTATAGLTPMTSSPAPATLALAVCHSLFVVENKIAGDPIEAAAMKAIGWEVSTTNPNVCQSKSRTLALKLESVSVPSNGVEILTRHHFNSKLKRMSVVAKFVGQTDGGWVFVKGSPEAIAVRVKDLPRGFDGCVRACTKRGMRVLALAYKRLSSMRQVDECVQERSKAEEDLTYAGLVGFTCKVRKDTSDVVHVLREGGHMVSMATGDALETAVHVAREVGITTHTKRGALTLEIDQSTGALHWSNYDTGVKYKEFESTDLQTLSKDWDVCCTGEGIKLAMETGGAAIVNHLDKICVYARMTPDMKESVIKSVHKAGHITMMCGDGANDVGALKNSDVGVALLSGFGDVNTEKEPSKENTASTGATAIITADEATRIGKMKPGEIKKMILDLDPNVRKETIEACVEKADLAKLYRAVRIEVAKKNALVKKKPSQMTPQERKAEAARQQKENIEKKQQEFKEEYESLVARGESWAMFKAAQNMWKKEAEKQKEIKAKIEKQGSIAFTASQMAKMMEELEDGDTPVVKVGDASIAAPFTSKMPSIRSTADVIKQGRCTLVTSLQMYQILALNCLINSYSLSVLQLQGVKYGDVQMTCLGILMSISFVTISRSKPLDKLSNVRPLTSIFHPSLFLSLLGQFALHLMCMMYCTSIANAHTAEYGESVPLGGAVAVNAKFKPSLLNSVVYLVTAVQQVGVFVVNLKGPPFMGGITQNTPLLWSLAFVCVCAFVCASESFPQLNKWLQLVPFPSSEFRRQVMMALAVDVCGALLWDRLCMFVFAFNVFKASMKATTMQDVTILVRSAILVSVVVYFIASQDEEVWTQAWEEAQRQAEETSTAKGLVEGVQHGADPSFEL